MTEIEVHGLTIVIQNPLKSLLSNSPTMAGVVTDFRDKQQKPLFINECTGDKQWFAKFRNAWLLEEPQS